MTLGFGGSLVRVFCSDTAQLGCWRELEEETDDDTGGFSNGGGREKLPSAQCARNRRAGRNDGGPKSCYCRNGNGAGADL
jgi:hypothetical protein